MTRLLIPTWDGIPFTIVDAVKRTFVVWQKKIDTASDPEKRLEKALKDLAMSKTICDNGKVLELPYVKTLLKNATDDGSFQNSIMLRRQNLQFVILPSYGPTKLLDVSKPVSKWTHIKISYKHHEVLNSLTLMEKASKKNSTGSGSETKNDEE